MSDLVFGEPVPAGVGVAGLVFWPATFGWEPARWVEVAVFAYLTVYLGLVRPGWRRRSAGWGLRVLFLVPVCLPLLRAALRRRRCGLDGAPQGALAAHARRWRGSARDFAGGFTADVALLRRGLGGMPLWLLLDLDLGLPARLDRLLRRMERQGAAVGGDGYLFPRGGLLLDWRARRAARSLGWGGPRRRRLPRFMVVDLERLSWGG